MDKLGIVLLTLFGCAQLFHYTASFEIHKNDPLTVLQENNARFFYGLRPWPMPCTACRPNRTELVKYRNVQFEFWNKTSNARLCAVSYKEGVYDPTADPPCNQSSPRMLEFAEGTFVGGILFEVTMVTLYDQGNYGLVIRYGDPDVQAEKPLTVQVKPSAPGISQQPTGELTTGNEVTLECRVGNSNPPADLRWTRGVFEEIRPEDINYHKATDWKDTSWSRIQFKTKPRDHGQSYVCSAWNDLNEADPSSASVSLQVKHIPIVRLHPCKEQSIKYHVIKGENARFDCQIEAYPSVSEVTWYNAPDASNPGGATRLPAAPNQTTYTLSNVQVANQKSYYCTAQNVVGTTPKILCDMEVQYPATLELPPTTKIKKGSDVKLQCLGEANPPVISYKWTSSRNESFEHHEPELDISNAQPEDVANYTCRATNVMTPTGRTDIQYVATATTELLVEYMATLAKYALTQFVARTGQQAVMLCHVDAYPQVNMRWRFRGAYITSGGRYTIRTVDVNRGRLEISSVTGTDLGAYECESVNSEGTLQIPLQLQEPGVPNEPQDCWVTVVSSSEVTLMCVPGYDGGELLTLTVERQQARRKRRHLASSLHHSASNNNDTTTIAVKIGSLNPDTRYTLRVYGQNKHGRSQNAYSINVQTIKGAGGPGGGSQNQVNVGAIVGGVIGGLVAVAGLVVLSLWLYWKYEPKKDDEEQNQGGRPKKKTPYSTLDNAAARRYAHRVEVDKEGHQNAGFEKQDIQDGSAVPNVYEDHPGTSRTRYSDSGPTINPTEHGYVRDASVNRFQEDGHIEIVADVHTGAGHSGMSGQRRTGVSDQMPSTSSGREAAGGQMKRQSNLAGMGALSRMSEQSLIQAARGRQEMDISSVARKTRGDQDMGHLYDVPPRSSNAPRPVSAEVGPRPRHRGRQTYVADERWEIPRDDITFRQCLGKGMYGEVWRAVASDIRGKHGPQVVAVKMVKENSPPEERYAFLRELEVMKMLKPHPHIITLIGCNTAEEPEYIIMELANRGNLLQFLRENRPVAGYRESRALTTRDLVIFAMHVASGMEYISSNELLHRDLSARNVLLTDRLNCKISDFGLARDIINCREYESKTNRRLPIRWMSQESLFDNIYSTKSDVWSFGTLLWEIVTLGSSPYPGMSGAEVMELIQMGYIMDKPTHCSDSIYAIMRECWRHNPDHRPTFSTLIITLDAILIDLVEDPRDNIYVTQMYENMFDILPEQPGERT